MVRSMATKTVLHAPISEALRVAGVAMICETHGFGTEYGYPLLCAAGSGIVRVSTGTIFHDGGIGPSTSTHWIVESGKSTPICREDVLFWSAETAWNYRMRQEMCIEAGGAEFCVFELPCDMWCFFKLPTPSGVNVWKPEEHKIFKDGALAIAWCRNELHKAEKAARRKARSK
jgi:hypothetical protein